MPRLRSFIFVLGLLSVGTSLTGCIEYAHRGYGWHYGHRHGHGRW